MDMIKNHINFMQKFQSAIDGSNKMTTKFFLAIWP